MICCCGDGWRLCFRGAQPIPGRPTMTRKAGPPLILKNLEHIGFEVVHYSECILWAILGEENTE